MPGPEMKSWLDAGPDQLRAVAVAVTGRALGGKFATSKRKARFPYDLALSLELAYIDCIFLPIHTRRLHFPLSCQTQTFGCVSFCDISIYVSIGGSRP